MAKNWSRVQFAPGCDLSCVKMVRFLGTVRIGLIARSEDLQEGIYNATIANCTIGNHPRISNVTGELRGLEIAAGVTIRNVGSITLEPGASCGIGTMVSVLDETGSRPVPLFPGLTSQWASLIARYPKLAEKQLIPLLSDNYEQDSSEPAIGEGARIINVREMTDVRVDKGVTINGASRLINGTIINNSPKESVAYIGCDVDAINFLVVDGRVDSGCLLRNCFVGQGVELDKRFTAHDSLFFANSSCEAGEACAIIAGPYTVTMHKSSLLIGAEYSFMNIGSGTNSSNHMYKLGPVHWGTMERGVKTASGAYMMWNGRIGAYSLLMGHHKTHPDTSLFPFSYLFGSPKGRTVVTPGIMLRSCGLTRDMVKWPARDRRIKAGLPLMDHISFDVLNPLTVSTMLKALAALSEIAKLPQNDDGYIESNGLLFSANSLKRAEELYTMAVVRYFHRVLENGKNLKSTHDCPVPGEWMDLGGQILPAETIELIRQAESVEEIQQLLDSAYANYPALEYSWVQSQLTPYWQGLLADAPAYIQALDTLIEQDRAAALASTRL